MVNVLDLDERIEGFHENDSGVQDKYMLIPERVSPEIDKSRAKVLVMNPIMNSFEAWKLLKRFGQGKVI